MVSRATFQRYGGLSFSSDHTEALFQEFCSISCPDSDIFLTHYNSNESCVPPLCRSNEVKSGSADKARFQSIHILTLPEQGVAVTLGNVGECIFLHGMDLQSLREIPYVSAG